MWNWCHCFRNLKLVFLSKKPPCQPPPTPPPPVSSVFFIFMQFCGGNGQIIYWETLDPPLLHVTQGKLLSYIWIHGAACSNIFSYQKLSLNNAQYLINIISHLMFFIWTARKPMVSWHQWFKYTGWRNSSIRTVPGRTQFGTGPWIHLSAWTGSAPTTEWSQHQAGNQKSTGTQSLWSKTSILKMRNAMRFAT